MGRKGEEEEEEEKEVEYRRTKAAGILAYIIQ